MAYLLPIFINGPRLRGRGAHGYSLLVPLMVLMGSVPDLREESRISSLKFFLLPILPVVQV